MKKAILMDIPLPIVTPRLVLDIAKPGEGAEIFEAVEETRAQLAAWMSWEKATKCAEDCEGELRKAYARFILREELRLVAREKHSRRITVLTGFHEPNWDIMQFEIGYWTRASAQGKGYATECANVLIRYGFGALGAKRMVIGHAEGNEASSAVIARLGMKLECRRAKTHLLPDGRIVDDFRYVRLDAEGLAPLEATWGKGP